MTLRNGIRSGILTLFILITIPLQGQEKYQIPSSFMIVYTDNSHGLKIKTLMQDPQSGNYSWDVGQTDPSENSDVYDPCVARDPSGLITFVVWHSEFKDISYKDEQGRIHTYKGCNILGAVGLGGVIGKPKILEQNIPLTSIRTSMVFGACWFQDGWVYGYQSENRYLFSVVDERLNFKQSDVFAGDGTANGRPSIAYDPKNKLFLLAWKSSVPKGPGYVIKTTKAQVIDYRLVSFGDFGSDSSLFDGIDSSFNPSLAFSLGDFYLMTTGKTARKDVSINIYKAGAEKPFAPFMHSNYSLPDTDLDDYLAASPKMGFFVLNRQFPKMAVLINPDGSQPKWFRDFLESSPVGGMGVATNPGNY